MGAFLGSKRCSRVHAVHFLPFLIISVWRRSRGSLSDMFGTFLETQKAPPTPQKGASPTYVLSITNLCFEGFICFFPPKKTSASPDFFLFWGGSGTVLGASRAVLGASGDDFYSFSVFFRGKRRKRHTYCVYLAQRRRERQAHNA